MDAFFALEGGRALGAERDGLAGTHADAGFFQARDAALAVEEDDVIGVAGHGLHFAAHQQRVLVGDEETAVEGNLRPAAGAHERVVERAAVVEGERGSFAQVEFGLAGGRDGRNLLGRGRNVGTQREAATGESGERHAREAADESLVKTVAGVLRLARAAFDRAGAAALFVGFGEVLLGKRQAGAEDVEDGFGQLHAGGPGLVDAGAGEHVGRAGALADAGIAVAA